MNIHDVLTSRRTIHDYQSTPVSGDILDRALEAAVRAPNHKLTNPWRFSRLGPGTRQVVTEIGIELKQRKGGLSPEATQRLRDKLSRPPELLIVSQVLSDDAARHREDYAAVACAIENLMLSLWADGVGSKWSTGAVTTDPRTYEAARIDPEVEEIVGFVWIGYPAEVPNPGRRPLHEVFRQLP
jgi:nitroreductase